MYCVLFALLTLNWQKYRLLEMRYLIPIYAFSDGQSIDPSISNSTTLSKSFIIHRKFFKQYFLTKNNRETSDLMIK